MDKHLMFGAVVVVSGLVVTVIGDDPDAPFWVKVLANVFIVFVVVLLAWS